MATYTKNLLSGSTNGKQILVSGTTSGAAITVHTAVAGTSALDEVYIYAYNLNTVNVTLTLMWGGTTSPDDYMTISISAQAGRVLLVDGKLLQNGLIVKAFASDGTSILLDGFVNKIT